MMKASNACYEIIREFEGLELVAYLDGAGVWTVGYGHTEAVRHNTVITRDEAERFLLEDVARFERLMRKILIGNLKQCELDALISWAYNVGEYAAQTSTLIGKFNKGDKLGAGNEFMRWVYSKKKRLPGLVRRRVRERELFLRP